MGQLRRFGGAGATSCRSDQRGEVALRCPGEIPEETGGEPATGSNEDPVGCTVWNDLSWSVAVEVEFGQGSGWQVMYPEARLKVPMPSLDGNLLRVSVRLRDDVNVCGVCRAVPGCTLMLSTSFGDFGYRATEHFLKEGIAAERELMLREQRQKEIDQEMNQEVSRAIRWRQKLSMISLSVCLLIPLAAMVACTVAAFSLRTELQGVGLAVTLLGLTSCAGCGCYGLAVAGGADSAFQDMRHEVRASRPDLRRFQDTGVDPGDDWRSVTFVSCLCCIPVVVLGCLAAMTVASALNGYAGAAVLWGWVALMMCCGGVSGWRLSDVGAGWRGRAGNALGFALFFPLMWPIALLFTCGFGSRFVALLLKPATRSLDAAVHTIHEHTIVFEGNVLPGRETVCSWPGKYATAWDTLVAGSRTDNFSAAVVFLPEGSKDFGLHDPIPASQDLRDLHGECWCTPLYGERKPWGCRWWSKWISNVEQAASQQCTLEVYYFNGMRGKGKVKDFTTAGEEHMRREAIERRRDAFLKSGGFSNALEAGLKHLPKEKGPDSSSPYSREVQRLFLAWLPEEDRQFLASSEGIGNSQKAEVAWLERKGYSYIEREVRELESSSPKAIGRATE